MASPFSNNYTKADRKAGFRVFTIPGEYGENWDVIAKEISEEGDYFVKVEEGKYQYMRYGYREGAKVKQISLFPMSENFYTSPTDILSESIVEKSGFGHIIGVKFGSGDDA